MYVQLFNVLVIKILIYNKLRLKRLISVFHIDLYVVDIRYKMIALCLIVEIKINILRFTD